MSACPNCGMFQTAVLRPEDRCQHCGYLMLTVSHYTPKPTYPDTSNTEMIRFLDIIKEQSQRITELEAELASLKDMHKAKWVESYSRICLDITEEGEG